MYAITPNRENSTSENQAPLRPTRLLTDNPVPRSDHAGSIGEYENSASIVNKASASNAIKPTSLRGAAEGIERAVLTIHTVMTVAGVYPYRGSGTNFSFISERYSHFLEPL